MPRNQTLSPAMTVALDDIRVRCNGTVIRLPGGFWTYQGCPWGHRAPSFYIGTSTIQALVDRGHLDFSEWKDGRKGRFPVAASLTGKP